jgi:hypothetical protein
MTNPLKMLLQMQNGFLQFESTLETRIFKILKLWRLLRHLLDLVATQHLNHCPLLVKIQI